jgi:hypothetical protein
LKDFDFVGAIFKSRSFFAQLIALPQHQHSHGFDFNPLAAPSSTAKLGVFGEDCLSPKFLLGEFRSRSIL